MNSIQEDHLRAIDSCMFIVDYINLMRLHNKLPAAFVPALEESTRTLNSLMHEAMQHVATIMHIVGICQLNANKHFAIG